MSLDVWLRSPQNTTPRGSGIYIREDGQTKEITRSEWDARYPDREPIAVLAEDMDDTVYEANITHNLGRMADVAGIYQALWRPEEINVTHAAQLIPLLRDGLAKLQADPVHFEQFNPSNGWGSYTGFVQFVADYLAACEAYPEATVSISR